MSPSELRRLGGDPPSPLMTMVEVSGLIDSRMLVELEAVAVLRKS